MISHNHQYRIKTYARTVGKGLSAYHRSLLENKLSDYSLYVKHTEHNYNDTSLVNSLSCRNHITQDITNPLFNDSNKSKHLNNTFDLLSQKFQKRFLEIGFGMGENILQQAIENPNALFVGAEVYLNGVAKVLDRIESEKIQNIILWPNDVHLLFSSVPNEYFDGIYVLFPDPWTKKKHNKRRIMNAEIFNTFNRILKNLESAFILYGTDIHDYYQHVVKIINQCNDWKLKEDDITRIFKTKYYKKAETCDKAIYFLDIQKNYGNTQ